jgi:hypothetical protein
MKITKKQVIESKGYSDLINSYLLDKHDISSAGFSLKYDNMLNMHRIGNKDV